MTFLVVVQVEEFVHTKGLIRVTDFLFVIFPQRHRHGSHKNCGYMRMLPVVADIAEKPEGAHLVEYIADDDEVGVIFVEQANRLLPRLSACDFYSITESSAQFTNYGCRSGDEDTGTLGPHAPGAASNVPNGVIFRQ